MIKISAELNDHRLQGVIDFLALGVKPAYVRIYAGLRPPELGGSPVGDLLVELPMAEPIGTILNGVLTLTASEEAMVTATGQASWARVFNGEDTLGWDCDVTDQSGTGDIRLVSVNMYAGGYARIVSGTLR